VNDRLGLGDRPVSGEARLREARDGMLLLGAIVALMWLVEAVHSLDGDGIHARSLPYFWGILTSPFIHASFQHLIDNTIPFVFLGVIIAVRGALRLGVVTGLIIVIGGIGTWLISPAHVVTIGASGVVFGYATYLLTRGVFDRSPLELAIGVIVGVVWGAVLLASLIPQHGVSWQAHVCGGIAGVIVAWRMSRYDRRPNRQQVRAGTGSLRPT
jgi:membrane associated rhomboid family serine protease